ncbi:MAG: NUDIX hydrolase [Actinomycetota bacterium]
MGEFLPSRPLPALKRPSSAKAVHAGSIFTVWQWPQQVSETQTRTYEQLSRRDTAVILPISGDGRLLLAREEQPGMKARLHSLGGKVEPDESPEAAARRELMEEAGVAVDRISLWHAWQPLSKIDWAVHVFWASNAREVRPPSLEAGEAISQHWVDAEGFLEGNVPSGFDDAELTFLFGLARIDPAHRQQMIRSYQQCSMP